MPEPTSKLIPGGTLRVHSWTWAVVSVMLIIVQLLWPGRVWMTMLVILGGTWLLGFAWALSIGRRLSIERRMRYGWAQVGDLLQERYTLDNRSLLPALWLEVEDRSSLPGYQTGRVTAVNGRESLVWQTEGVCTRRGLYTLGPTSLRGGDPLGLFSVEVTQPDSTVLLVLPPVLPLPEIEIAAGGTAGEGRRLRRVALETTVSAQTVHEYLPGDPPRAIHWPTSARREALFVRQFDHMPSADWWIFLDLEGRAQAGAGLESTGETGIVLAASLADRGLRQGVQVGLVACGQSLTWLPPRRSSTQLMDILRALALIQPGDVPLAELLRQGHKALRGGASLIVITPNAQADWVAALLHLAGSGIVPTILLLDPASFGGTASSAGVARVLTALGVPHTLVPRGLLDRPEAQPGRQGRWGWRVVGPGRVVVERRPVEAAWRRLG